MSVQLTIPVTDDPPEMKCPCGNDYVHMTSVLVDQNGEVTEVRPKRPAHGYSRSPSGTDGTIVEIGCYCERGHTFTVRFQFHHGRTLLSSTNLQDLPSGPVGIVQWPEELWRR